MSVAEAIRGYAEAAAGRQITTEEFRSVLAAYFKARGPDAANPVPVATAADAAVRRVFGETAVTQKRAEEHSDQRYQALRNLLDLGRKS